MAQTGKLDFLPETASFRQGDCTVVPAPTQLQDRRVEMTEPASPAKMAINALSSGANFWLAAGGGPHYYLPKLKSHLEARPRNEIFVFAQPALSIPHGSIRATVLIETIPAPFEMDEILYTLRAHAS